jgi:hypothetical protein
MKIDGIEIDIEIDNVIDSTKNLLTEDKPISPAYFAGLKSGN